MPRGACIRCTIRRLIANFAGTGKWARQLANAARAHARSTHSMTLKAHWEHACQVCERGGIHAMSTVPFRLEIGHFGHFHCSA